MARRVALADDDDDDLRASIHAALRSRGYTVVDATDGDQLQLLLDKGSFDVVISDLDMPGRRGTDILADRRRSGDATPFIVMTGSPHLTTAELADCARTWLLAKPFRLSTLWTALALAMG